MASNEDLRYQIVELPENLPFRINRVVSAGSDRERDEDRSILEHWHPEYEIVYTLSGHAIHYIDGQQHEAGPGSLFVVNSESIHKVLPDMEDAKQASGTHTVAIVLLIDRSFMEEYVPGLNEMYFLSESLSETEEQKETETSIMTELGRHPTDDRAGDSLYIAMHLMSLIYELLYRLCLSRLVRKETVLPINSEKNLERLRGVIEYVSAHYSEEITQAQVAKRFYFTKEYFARFFRRNTGFTFMEFVCRYRLGTARRQLVETDHTVTEIALDCGFPDSRSLINAFGKYYGITPLKFRKKAQGCNLT